MSIPLATLNTLLVNYVTNTTLLNDLLALGANNYTGGLTSAVQNAATGSIDILKVLVTADEGLTISTQNYDLTLMNYFKANATNQVINAIWCAQNGFPDGFNSLSSYVTNNNDLLLCYTSLEYSTNVETVLANSPTNLNDCLLIAVTKCNITISNLLINAGANNFLTCIEAIKNVRNNSAAEAILSTLLLALA